MKEFYDYSYHLATIFLPTRQETFHSIERCQLDLEFILFYFLYAAIHFYLFYWLSIFPAFDSPLKTIKSNLRYSLKKGLFRCIPLMLMRVMRRKRRRTIIRRWRGRRLFSTSSMTYRCIVIQLFLLGLDDILCSVNSLPTFAMMLQKTLRQSQYSSH